jgi:HK97 gp10 family phage protein
MMAETVEFSILGLDSLMAKLESVTYDMKRKGGRSALRRAAAVIAENAKARAMLLDDAETGRSIADNIVLRWNGWLFKRTGDLGFRIGVKHGAVLKDGGELSADSPTPHWRLLEFGTQYMAADPFMRPALEESISDATNVFVSEYEKTIDRAIKRAARASGGG